MPSSTPTRRSSNERYNNTLGVALEVCQRTALTRKDLQNRFGRSSGAITSYVRTLREAGILEPEPVRFGGGDQSYLQLAGDLARLVAVDLHHDRAEITFTDANYAPTAPDLPLVIEGLDLDGAPREALEAVARTIRGRVAPRNVKSRRRVAVGLALPSPIDVAEQQTASPQILPGLLGMKPGRFLQNQLPSDMHVQVITHNDATLGALGAHMNRLHTDATVRDETLIYVRVADGVGAGLIVRGMLCDGARGVAGEIGHFKLDEGGELCSRCGGVGCLETLASAQAIVEKVRRGHVPVDSIKDVLSSEHPACMRALRDAGREVGRALAHAAILLNPDRIVLGGAVAASDEFLPAVERALERDAFGTFTPVVELAEHEHGLTPELAGALALARGTVLPHVITGALRRYFDVTSASRDDT